MKNIVMKIIKIIINNFFKEHVIVEKKTIDDLTNTLMDTSFKYIQNKIELEMLKLDNRIDKPIIFKQNLN